MPAGDGTVVADAGGTGDNPPAAVIGIIAHYRKTVHAAVSEKLDRHVGSDIGHERPFRIVVFGPPARRMGPDRQRARLALLGDNFAVAAPDMSLPGQGIHIA